jgi:hypothetical protein
MFNKFQPVAGVDEPSLIGRFQRRPDITEQAAHSRRQDRRALNLRMSAQCCTLRFEKQWREACEP